MKKVTSLILLCFLVLTAVCFSGCNTQKAQVTSVLNIDENFSGSRLITVKLPLSCDVDSIQNDIMEKGMYEDMENVSCEYLGVEQDGYTFEFEIKFSSKDEYESSVSKILGREASVFVSKKNTVLTNGFRMKEDFDTGDLISFLTKVSKNNKSTGNVEYDYAKNTVTVGTDTFDTQSTVDISTIDGVPINSIKIRTVNSKEGVYDRTIIFSIPNDTYNKLSNELTGYFETNTSPKAQYYGFTSQGEAWEYQVIYKGLSLDETEEVTRMILDSDSDSIFYGDRDNSSTPLSEGLTFEESFDTFSFVGKDKKPIKVTYEYALPTLTTHGDGSIKKNGDWQNTGEWTDGVFSLDFTDDVFSVRIPDGIEYNISGINFILQIDDEDSFVRTTEFLYSKNDGENGRNYAYNFFAKKNADVEKYETDDSLVCAVKNKGTSAEITEQLVKYFGSGNFVNYDIDENALSLSKKTSLTDYISLGHMLNSNNALQPMTYTVHTKSNENMVSLNDDLGSTTYAKDGGNLSINFTGGKSTVVYHGNIPIVSHIIVYIIVCAVLLCATIFLIIFMTNKKVFKRRKKEKSDV